MSSSSLCRNGKGGSGKIGRLVLAWRGRRQGCEGSDNEASPLEMPPTTRRARRGPLVPKEILRSKSWGSVLPLLPPDSHIQIHTYGSRTLQAQSYLPTYLSLPARTRTAGALQFNPRRHIQPQPQPQPPLPLPSIGTQQQQKEEETPHSEMDARRERMGDGSIIT